MSKQDYYFMRLIGESSFSTTSIYLAQCKSVKTLKSIRVTDLDKTENGRLLFLQKELCLIRRLNHPNILVHDLAFVEKHELIVVTDMMSYGSCTDIMECHFRYGLPERLISYIFVEVLKALQHMHNLGFVHRGIKASHILLSVDGAVKVSGLRNMISLLNNDQRISNVYDFPKHATQLLPWLSPEILQQNMEGYNTQSDVYSIGITACELANGHAPFTDMPNTQMLIEKLNGTTPCLLDKTTVPPNSEIEDQGEEVEQQHNISMSRSFSAAFHKFVYCCLKRLPVSRPTVTQLLAHRFCTHVEHNKNNFASLLNPIVPIASDITANVEDLEKLNDKMKGVKITDYQWIFES